MSKNRPDASIIYLNNTIFYLNKVLIDTNLKILKFNLLDAGKSEMANLFMGDWAKIFLNNTYLINLLTNNSGLSG